MSFLSALTKGLENIIAAQARAQAVTVAQAQYQGQAPVYYPTYDQGYSDSSDPYNVAAQHAADVYAAAYQHAQYQTGYNPQMPWFQQAPYATQVPMQYRHDLFQYQSPFYGAHQPVNVVW